MTFCDRGLAIGMMAFVLFSLGCDGRKAANLSQATFHVESVKSTTGATMTTDKYGVALTRLYTFTACVTDVASRSALPPQVVFGISDGSNQVTATTQTGGCFNWNEQHQVSDTQSERMLRIQRTFIGRGVYQGKESVDLGFDPWGTSDNVLTDLRYSMPVNLENQIQTLSFNSSLQALDIAEKSSSSGVGVAPQTLAFTSDLKLDFIGQDKAKTQIDTLLGLKIVQRFHATLHPKFVRTDLNGQPVYLDVKGGQFKMNIIVVTQPKDDASMQLTPATLVGYYEGLVTVGTSGDVTSDIDLLVVDPAAALSRTSVLVLLRPTEGRAAAEVGYGAMEGYLAPLNGVSVEASLEPAKSRDQKSGNVATADPTLLADQVDKLMKDVSSAPETGLQHFYATNKDLGPVNLDIISALSAATKQKPGTFARSQVLSEICGYLYKGHGTFTVSDPVFGNKLPDHVSVAEACSDQVEKFVSLEARDYVESVNGQPVHQDFIGNDMLISISRTLTVDNTASTSKGYDYSAKLSASGGLAVSTPQSLPVASASVGVSLGGEAFYMHSRSLGQSQTVGASTAQVQALFVAVDNYKIPVTVRRCVTVRSTQDGGKAGVYFCDKAGVAKDISETYYLINHQQANSPFADSDGSSSLDLQNLRMLVRGQDMFTMVSNMLTQQNAVLEFDKILAPVDTNSFLMREVPDLKMIQANAGMASETP